MLLFLCIQNSRAQDAHEELDEVIVYSPCHPDNPEYDECFCNPSSCDSGDCTDPLSSEYPCSLDDPGYPNGDTDDCGECDTDNSGCYDDDDDCTNPDSAAYPCTNDDGGSGNNCDDTDPNNACEADCEELTAQKDELEKELEELVAKGIIKQKSKKISESLKKPAVIGNLIISAISGIKNLTEEQISFYYNNEHERDLIIFNHTVNYRLDLGTGDRTISEETLNKTEEEVALEILGHLGTLSDLGQLLLHRMVPGYTKIISLLDSAASQSISINNQKVSDKEKEIFNVDEELTDSGC